MESKQGLNWQISGHNAQLGLLEKAIQDKRLAHAYIFSGPSQIGKKTAARRIAQFLLCESNSACDSCIHCRTFNVGSNADYIEISGDEAIKIDSVRDLGYKLSLKAYAGIYKIAVIDNAHNLTTEAANALLKVLEEPKPNTMMILVTDNAYRLLPTISSRAQKINFGPLNEENFKTWLSSRGFSAPDPSFAGRPGYVVNLSSEPEALTNNEDRLSAFKEFLNGTLGEKLILAANLAEKETIDLKHTFDHWLHHLEQMLRENPTPKIVNKINGLIRAQRLLDQNVNSKLLLSELMVKTN